MRAPYPLKAAHNLSVWLGYMNGKHKGDVSDGGVELHPNYRAMAVANGVDPDDPLTPSLRRRERKGFRQVG